MRNKTLLTWGRRPQTPAIFRFTARMAGGKINALERRIGLSSDGTRAPTQGPEWPGRLRSPHSNQTRRSITYCGRKMVLTTRTTFNIVIRKGSKAENGEAALPEEKKIVPAKDGTIRQEMKTFRAILNFAADRDYIRERQIPRGNIPLEDDSREAFTPAEYKHLHTHARNEWIEKGKTAREVWYRRMAYQLMLIMANTGMRPSEARNLRWRDFDTRKAKDGREFVCLKVRGKGKHRELVATLNVAAYLERVRELAENLPPFKDGAQPAKRAIKLDDFIFCNAKGASATELYDTVISDLLKDAGLLIGPLGSRRSTYCFRHTYATFRLIEGVDVIWLAKQMGTSVKMIEKHYGHITPTTDAGRILQGTPGWEPLADGSGEVSDGVNAGGAGKKTAKPRTKK